MKPLHSPAGRCDGAGDAGGLNFFRSIISSFFLAPGALNPPGATVEFPHGCLGIGISMSGEVSYFSRFFVKFVKIIAAGLASAISAYLLAHFGGLLLSSPTPRQHRPPFRSVRPPARSPRASEADPARCGRCRRSRRAAHAEGREGCQGVAAAQAHKD
jgi:hypothetical protein